MYQLSVFRRHDPIKRLIILLVKVYYIARIARICKE